VQSAEYWLEHGQQDAALRGLEDLPQQAWDHPWAVRVRVAADVGEVRLLNTISLAGGRCGRLRGVATSARSTQNALLANWRPDGLPGYAQSDDDLRFRDHPDGPGPVGVLCLAVDVCRAFPTPHEHGLQNQIESINSLWQAKVSACFDHAGLARLRRRSDRLVATRNPKVQDRQDAALSSTPLAPPQCHSRLVPTQGQSPSGAPMTKGASLFRPKPSRRRLQAALLSPRMFVLHPIPLDCLLRRSGGHDVTGRAGPLQKSERPFTKMCLPCILIRA